MSPSFVFILPTTECRARCPHCFYETGHTPRVRAVDFLDELDGALDLLVEDGLQQVILSGGEPLLAPRLRRLVELSASKLVHVLLLTRGGPLDEETLEVLEAAGLDDVTISATDPDAELRSTVHRVLFRSRYKPSLLTCFSRKNVGMLAELLSFSAGLAVPHLFTPAFIPRTSPRFEELSLHGLDEAGWARALEVLGPWASEGALEPYLELVAGFYAGRRVHPGSCAMGSEGLVVDADGSVYPCFHRHDLRAGNILAGPFSSILAALGRIRRELSGAPCFGEHCLSMFAGLRDLG